MPTELLPHCRQHFLSKRVLLARAEAHEQRRREHVHRDRFVDGRLDRPAALAGVLHEARIFGQRGILHQRHRGEIEQPRTDDAAPPPDLGYVSKVQIILLIFRELRLIRIAEDVETFGVGLHDAVFNSVMNHLHEVASAGRPTVNVAVFRSAGDLLTAGSAWNLAAARGESFENGIELVEGFFRAADHHAVAAFQAPDSAAGADVYVVNALVFKELRATNVVFEIRIAAIDENVACLKLCRQRLNRRFGRAACRNHEPGDPWRAKLSGKVVERRGRNRTFAGHVLYGISTQIGDNYLVTAAHEASRHVGAHPPKTYHSQTHTAPSLPKTIVASCWLPRMHKN